MAVDLRQVMAAFLTFSMFIMLGNMIKRDHIDPLMEPLPVSPKVEYNALKIVKPAAGMHKLSEMISYGPWKDLNQSSTSCWNKPSLRETEQSKGYIFFSLSHNPEFHASQVANAVVIARHLGATLILPDIKGIKFGVTRHFGEIYDVDKFIKTLNGVVRVDKNPPTRLSNGRIPVVRVPNKVPTNFIASNIEPSFKTKRALKIVTYFSSSSTIKRVKENALECVAKFETLNLQPNLQEVVGSMVETLRSLSQKTRGRFVAVDLRVDRLKMKSCLKSKWCYNGEEIGGFLKKIGFHADTTVYLTQTGWNTSLNALRNVFPNTFTKDAIMPADEKAKYTGSEIHEYEKFIDFHMCTQADVFVPAFPSRFYTSIVGKRIANGKTQILIPAKNASTFADDYISPYITKKTHSAYSCFC